MDTGVLGVAGILVDARLGMTFGLMTPITPLATAFGKYRCCNQTYAAKKPLLAIRPEVASVAGGESEKSNTVTNNKRSSWRYKPASIL